MEVWAVVALVSTYKFMTYFQKDHSHRAKLYQIQAGFIWTDGTLLYMYAGSQMDMNGTGLT